MFQEEETIQFVGESFFPSRLIIFNTLYNSNFKTQINKYRGLILCRDEITIYN